ncbi:MAG TPA: hypothetical protein VGL32_02060 [Acidimicrobiales bacterium]|jgi:hypothetical protein
MSITRLVDQALREGDVGYVYNTARWNGWTEGIGTPAKVIWAGRKYATVEVEGVSAYGREFEVDRKEGHATGRNAHRRFLKADEAVKEDRFRAAVKVMADHNLGQSRLGGMLELTLEQAEGIAAALEL